MVFLDPSRLFSCKCFAFMLAVAVLRLLTASTAFTPSGEMSPTFSVESFQAQLFPSTSCNNYYLCPDVGKQKEAALADSVSWEHFCSVPRPLARRGKLKDQSSLHFLDSPGLILLPLTGQESCAVSTISYLSRTAAFK